MSKRKAHRVICKALGSENKRWRHPTEHGLLGYDYSRQHLAIHHATRPARDTLLWSAVLAVCENIMLFVSCLYGPEK